MVAKRKTTKAVKGIEWLTPEQGWEMFDQSARRDLGMSGEEFLRAWDAGELDPEIPEVMDMAFIIPFVR